MIVSVLGIDPGLVDTGLVCMKFMPDRKEVLIQFNALTRAKPVEIADKGFALLASYPSRKIFIEGYRPRSHLNTDARMIQLISDLRGLMPAAKVLNNTGIMKVVKPALLNLLKVNTFNVPTHHDDLRSAARIALLGMLKEPELNRILYDLVMDSLTPSSWQVTVI